MATATRISRPSKSVLGVNGCEPPMLRKAHCMSQCVTHSFSASIILSAVFWSTTCTNANPLQHAVSGNAGKGTQWSDGRTGTASLRGREQDGRPGSPRASQTVGAHRPCSSAHTRKQIGQLRSIPTAHTRSSYVEREVACSSERIINVISASGGQPGRPQALRTNMQRYRLIAVASSSLLPAANRRAAATHA